MRLRTGNRRRLRAQRRQATFERQLRVIAAAVVFETLSREIDRFHARVIPEMRALGEFMADWRSAA